VDAHVHFHPCFDQNEFFDWAYRNFEKAASRLRSTDSFAGALMLTESQDAHFFLEWQAQAASSGSRRQEGDYHRWIFQQTSEACSLLTRQADRELFIVAGRQVVTRENLELLLLGTDGRFQDGLSIEKMMGLARTEGLIHAVPWGTGKWLFKRGRILTSLINRVDDRKIFFLSDQGGRPVFWPTPYQLKAAQRLGIRVLSGSDPLPFPSEVQRPGSFGFLIDETIDPLRPAESIKRLIQEPRVDLVSFGRLQTSSRFILNQAKMQLSKHHNRKRRSQLSRT
jgi:hypothetical protein